MNSNMYAIRPKMNFRIRLENLFLTKNINNIAINIHPMEPKDIHILSIEETSNKSFPTFHENIISHEKRVVFSYNSSLCQFLKRLIIFQFIFFRTVH